MWDLSSPHQGSNPRPPHWKGKSYLPDHPVNPSEDALRRVVVWDNEEWLVAANPHFPFLKMLIENRKCGALHYHSEGQFLHARPLSSPTHMLPSYVIPHSTRRKVGLLLYHFFKRMKLSHRFLRESGQIQNINM